MKDLAPTDLYAGVFENPDTGKQRIVVGRVNDAIVTIPDKNGNLVERKGMLLTLMVQGVERTYFSCGPGTPVYEIGAEIAPDRYEVFITEEFHAPPMTRI